MSMLGSGTATVPVEMADAVVFRERGSQYDWATVGDESFCRARSRCCYSSKSVAVGRAQAQTKLMDSDNCCSTVVGETEQMTRPAGTDIGMCSVT